MSPHAAGLQDSLSTDGLATHAITPLAAGRSDSEPPPSAQDERSRSSTRPIKLSILMPVYNEERTLRQAIQEVLTQDFPIEIELHVVEDGSTDATRKILEQIRDPRMIVHEHPQNLGKGAALLTAARHATGTHVVPFDADLEYSAADVPRMLQPILAGRCDVVFGTRIFGVNSRYHSYYQAIGNRALTLATNLIFNCYLSDVHTCLKMMPLPLFLGLDLQESRFGLDAELTARILQLGIRPFEVPVSYYARSVADGKKITWRDGLHCLRVLAHVRRVGPDGLPLDVEAADQIARVNPTFYPVADAHEQQRHVSSDVVRAP